MKKVVAMLLVFILAFATIKTTPANPIPLPLLLLLKASLRKNPKKLRKKIQSTPKNPPRQKNHPKKNHSPKNRPNPLRNFLSIMTHLFTSQVRISI